MKRFSDFFTAWNWLCDHPIFLERYEHEKAEDPGDPHFTRNLSIEVVKVNPQTNSIDDDESKNTETRVWLECGPTSLREDYADLENMNESEREQHEYWLKNGGTVSHDIDLDCGGVTFEEAVIELANLVSDKYGDDRSKISKVR